MDVKKVLLVSSGIDSHCAAFLEKPQKTIHFDHEYITTNMVREHLPKQTTDTIGILTHHAMDRKTFNTRKMLILSLWGMSHGNVIIFGATAHDDVRQYGNDVTRTYNKLLLDIGPKIGEVLSHQVVTPYLGFSKANLVKFYREQGGNVQDLVEGTWSCKTSTDDKECGECASCIQKYIALALNGHDCYNRFRNDPRIYLRAYQNYSQCNPSYKEQEEIRQVLEL